MKPTNPIFLQAASNISRSFSGVKLQYNIADPEINSVTGSGDVTVRSIKDGRVIKEVYTNPSSTTISVEADAYTEIIITGSVTEINEDSTNTLISVYAQNSTLTSLILEGSTSPQEVTLINNTTLASVSAVDCSSVLKAKISSNTAAPTLDFGNCQKLRELDLGECESVTSLIVMNNQKISEIKFRATAQTPSTNIANAITAATSTTGTVYLNSADPYYSTVADAATAKGWTILPL